MDFEFKQENTDEVDIYLADVPLEEFVERCEEQTSARRHEVLLMMLFAIENLANEYGLPGPEFLMEAGRNRQEFRGEVRAAHDMRKALNRVIRDHGRKGPGGDN